jgi:hypothetical protein
MASIRIEDFEVDVENRRVKHTSGVVFAFYRYWNERDWRAAGPCWARNPSLYDGCFPELIALAKEAAVLNGMRHA